MKKNIMASTEDTVKELPVLALIALLDSPGAHSKQNEVLFSMKELLRTRF